MDRAWFGRISAAVLAGAAAATAIAAAVIVWYPDTRGLNRLYAGIFLGVGAWMALVFWCLFAPSGASAWWRAVLTGLAAAAAWLLHRLLQAGI